MWWRRATFISRAFRMVGSPECDHVTLPSKRALFASSRLPPSFFSLSVFEMKEFFLPNCAARQILERCNRKCYTIFLTGAIDILDSCDTLIFFSQNIWIKPGCLIGQEALMKTPPLSAFVSSPLLFAHGFLSEYNRAFLRLSRESLLPY